jgi:hypothetical protein
MATAGYLGMAIDADDNDDQVLHLIGALRAASAYTLLQRRPHPGRQGDRLRAAEALLEDSARRASERVRPGRHLRNVLLSSGFGALVWAFGDSGDALPFTLLGIAGGEAVLLSLPGGPLRDYEAYRNRYAAAGIRRPAWQLVAVPGGIGIEFPLGF